nr:ABC transporter permease subunit [Streptomyces boncukensis]
MLAAEWLKLWSLRSTAWTLFAGALAVLGLNAGTAWDHYRSWDRMSAESQRSFVPDGMPVLDAFTGNGVTFLMLVAAALGALTITGEYGTGLIRTTFAAVPARRSVMAAKVCVTAAVTTGFGTLLALVSYGVTQAILDTRGAGVPLDHPHMPRVLIASALLAPVSGLAGLALGAVLRHSAGAMVACLVVLMVLPLIVLDQRYWTALIDHALPYTAWVRLDDVQGTEHRADFPWTTTGAWTVYAGWALASAAVAVAAVHRRDQ